MTIKSRFASPTRKDVAPFFGRASVTPVMTALGHQRTISPEWIAYLRYHRKFMHWEGEMKPTLFISYSHGDNKKYQWIERLTGYFDGLKEQLPLDVWEDKRIGTGEKWQEEIKAAISRAAAAVLLVGPGFLASKFIKQNELPELLDAASAHMLRLYILVVAYCPWAASVLESYQAFNDPGTPLESMEDKDQNKWLNDLCLKISKDMRSAKIVTSKKIIAGKELRPVIASIMEHLEATHVAFLAQGRRRDRLVEAMQERLKIAEQLEYEQFFFRYHERMNAEEHFEFDQIRAFTEGPLYQGNRSILGIIEANPDVRDELPILGALKTHLIVWLNKYDRVFKTTKSMGVLYVGVEDGVPFPFGVDSEVAEWLNQHKA